MITVDIELPRAILTRSGGRLVLGLADNPQLELAAAELASLAEALGVVSVTPPVISWVVTHLSIVIYHKRYTVPR